MKIRILFLTAVAFIGLGISSANAAIINLFDYGFNIDGSGTNFQDGDFGGGLPGNVDASLFNFSTGIGQIDISFSGAGTHNALTFLDHEIDQATNTFFNENAFDYNSGSLGAGQSWEIDEPEYVFGDIYSNYMANTLDNSNAFGLDVDDVSMALGWDFALAAGQTGIASFFTSTSKDDADAWGGFYLEHYDPDSESQTGIYTASVFFWSDLSIVDVPTGLAEPGTLGLVLFGMLSVFGLRRRKTQ